MRIKRVFVAMVGIGVLLIPSVHAGQKPTTLSSSSAVLYEPQSGRVLYEKDPHTKRPMASTTKLMTALLAAETLPLDRVVTVPEQAVLVEGSSMGLRGGDRLTVQDLLSGLLLSSGNDAANALALLTAGSLPAFAVRMNERAQALGMYRSQFVTPSGLDAEGHGATAYDMALLGAAVLENPALTAICSAKVATVQVGNPPHEATLKNHNRLLWLYEPAVGLKTGYTKKSGKCLVSAATQDGVTLVVASLNGGDYWNDHIALFEYGFSQTQSVSLSVPTLPLVSVAGGMTTEVPLTAQPPANAVLLNGEESRVTCQLFLPPFVWAPVTEGQQLGILRYTVDNRLLYEIPLTAAAAVPQQAALSRYQQIKQRFCVLLKEWIR